MTDLRKAAEMAYNALNFNLPIIEDYGNKEQLEIHHHAMNLLVHAFVYSNVSTKQQNVNTSEKRIQISDKSIHETKLKEKNHD